MHAFYRSLFPFKLLFQWLSYDVGAFYLRVLMPLIFEVATKSFINREFAFTLPGDVYLRYQSFATGDDLKKEILRLIPSRFEIGPMYSQRVRHTASMIQSHL